MFTAMSSCAPIAILHGVVVIATKPV